jgi:hypothetical protein
MSKVRINDLARELEVKSRAILDVLDATPARSKAMKPSASANCCGRGAAPRLPHAMTMTMATAVLQK